MLSSVGNAVFSQRNAELQPEQQGSEPVREREAIDGTYDTADNRAYYAENREAD